MVQHRRKGKVRIHLLKFKLADARSFFATVRIDQIQQYNNPESKYVQSARGKKSFRTEVIKNELNDPKFTNNKFEFDLYDIPWDDQPPDKNEFDGGFNILVEMIEVLEKGEGKLYGSGSIRVEYKYSDDNSFDTQTLTFRSGNDGDSTSADVGAVQVKYEIIAQVVEISDDPEVQLQYEQPPPPSHILKRTPPVGGRRSINMNDSPVQAPVAYSEENGEMQDDTEQDERPTPAPINKPRTPQDSQQHQQQQQQQLRFKPATPPLQPTKPITPPPNGDNKKIRNKHLVVKDIAKELRASTELHLKMLEEVNKMKNGSQHVVSLQQLVERLLTELDKKNAILEQCQDELAKTQKENRRLEEVLKQHRITNPLGAVVPGGGSSSALPLPSEADILHMKLQKTQNEIILKNEIEKKYLELQQAHTAQCAYIQKLQEENARLKKYQKTAHKQEKVITKLETILQTRLAERNNNNNNNKGQTQTQQQTPMTTEAAATGANGDDNAKLTERELKLLFRCEKAEAQIHIMEDEIAENSKRYAKELANLRIKLSQATSQLKLNGIDFYS